MTAGRLRLQRLPGQPILLDPVAASLTDKVLPAEGLPLLTRCLTAWWRIDRPYPTDIGPDPDVTAAAVLRLVSWRCAPRVSTAECAQRFGVRADSIKAAEVGLKTRLRLSLTSSVTSRNHDGLVCHLRRHVRRRDNADGKPDQDSGASRPLACPRQHRHPGSQARRTPPQCGHGSSPAARVASARCGSATKITVGGSSHGRNPCLPEHPAARGHFVLIHSEDQGRSDGPLAGLTSRHRDDHRARPAARRPGSTGSSSRWRN
jgi:hypothetical protein